MNEVLRSKASFISSYADKYFAEELVELKPNQTTGLSVTGLKKCHHGT